MPNLVRHDARAAQDAVTAAIPVPNLVLPGPGKTGTTSLFWYLAQHREVCRASTKETLHFTPLSETEADADGRLPSLADYRGYFLHDAGERYLIESSPRYFHGGSRLAAGLAATLPDVRVLVTRRDPVTRTWSLFRYAKSRFFVPAEQTFEEYVEHCAALDAAGEPQTAVNSPTGASPTAATPTTCRRGSRRYRPTGCASSSSSRWCATCPERCGASAGGSASTPVRWPTGI